MSGNGTQAKQAQAPGRLSERAFWIAMHRVILSLAAVIKRYKIDVPVDD